MGGIVAAKSVQRGTAGTVTAVLACLGLLMAGCQSGPPEPSPTETAPFTVPEPSGASVHFTAQADIGVKKASKQVLDTIADLRPQFNLALGDFTYKAGIEQEFCDMVKAKLGQDFPYELLTGNHESDKKDGDIAKFVECLPNRLPGLKGEYGTQWYVDVPEQNPLIRFGRPLQERSFRARNQAVDGPRTATPYARASRGKMLKGIAAKRCPSGCSGNTFIQFESS
jgi:hypothetical protein